MKIDYPRCKMTSKITFYLIPNKVSVPVSMYVHTSDKLSIFLIENTADIKIERFEKGISLNI